MTTPPTHMQAIAIEAPGKETGRLALREETLPTPKPHEVLIKTAYAGINRADIFQRQGSYPAPEGASPLPGLEVSGTIATVGDGVSEWEIGAPVCALLPGGGYAEYATAHSGHIMPVPKGWSMAEAAALPEALITVWMALEVEASLKAGETLLVHGGASGIGMMAIQYAKHMGVHVIVTAGTKDKCAACLKWGADAAINYQTEDFVEAIQQNSGGVDVVLDMVGGDYIAKNFKLLKADGRLISIAFLAGAKLDQLNVAPLLLKRILWKGTTLRARSDETKAAWLTQIRAKLGPALRQNALKPIIDCEFSLKDAQKAHQHMEQNLNIGKIVLQV